MLDYNYVMSELKAKGRRIGELAALGVTSAEDVIEQYKFHYSCPGDPGGIALLIMAYEEFIKDYKENHLHPNEGGCWFCFRKDKPEDMVFDIEFDTNVHLSCLKITLEKMPNHPEAKAMKYLLED